MVDLTIDQVIEHRQIALAAGAVTFMLNVAGGIPDHAGGYVIDVEGGDIRWTADGQSPTATFGVLQKSGDEITFTTSAWPVQFWAVNGSPVLTVTFYG